MVTKSFGIYNDNNEQLLTKDDFLILEVGKSHIALVLTNSSNTVGGFELFTFVENESTIDKLFTAIGNTSHFINHSFPLVKVYINHELCLPVPSDKFSEGLTNDYLNMMFGVDTHSTIHTDHIDIHPQIVSVYSVSQELIDILTPRFSNIELKHTWTNVLKTIHKISGLSTNPLIYVQFYNTYFIAAVIKDTTLQLIQNFIYENPEDVLYQLLNVTTQYELDTNLVEVRVSGVIDPNYKLFRELSNYFKNLVSEKVDSSLALINVNDFPGHYFTPFFSLSF